MALTSSSAASTRPHVTRPQLPVTSGPSLSLTLLQPHSLFAPQIQPRAVVVPSAWNFPSSDHYDSPYFPDRIWNLTCHRDQGLGIYQLPANIPHTPWFLSVVPPAWFFFNITFRSEILLIICERIIVYKIHRTWILSTLLATVSLVPRTAWARQAQF